MEIIRAEEEWQRAGAYYVRIQAMAKKYHIKLNEEFDEHDNSETKYIVILDKDFPVATARMYRLNVNDVMIGRVVVLPEYRHRGLGTKVIKECEKWAKDLGFNKTILESRENKISFYKKLGYKITENVYIDGDTFRCVRMEKSL